MLSSASDFWLLLSTIIGSGVALTLVSSMAIATFRPSWLRPAGSRRRELAAVHHLFTAGSRQARSAA